MITHTITQPLNKLYGIKINYSVKYTEEYKLTKYQNIDITKGKRKESNKKNYIKTKNQMKKYISSYLNKNLTDFA